MDLLKNAIWSIQVGVSDYDNGDQARLHSAIRNIYAGVLLLYKEKLRRLSPNDSNDVLIRKRVRPVLVDGKLTFEGRGEKTVDVQDIKERFKALKIKTDWDLLQNIQDARNDIEHYYTQLSQKSLYGFISEAFIIIKDFISDELDDDPHNLLGEETWRRMLDVHEVYIKEREECEDLLNSINWISDALNSGVLDIDCLHCGSDLLKPEIPSVNENEVTLFCIVCGEREERESFIPRAISKVLAGEKYMSVKDGAEIPYVICPGCAEEAYVVEEQRCALCGCEVDDSCERCGTTIPPEELISAPYCGWCDNQLQKLMDDD